ncbi:hypothetical protein BCR15_10800 [Tessaracoccus lapidicaptus]|uniref:Uncharacterized protein n=1 Tax=Tessaracoccus lapidicaptus TaxID=1427523 RepID=A0A1C0ARX0_9ACTN|nr:MULTISPECIES: DUF3043 domain-containing protein [Tessaracoccus]AQX16658.1 hypothetical protein BKM78_12620 [Tessaracoccus sp. T2.5-30]OCL37188.1 hypothetical protein BCR15_10800 [Tessaracoccus lapidicaptus]VEP41378.1 hypothetical protein TLA_TLA_02541 [Tessaracoccus lapidicaptus]
MALFRPYERTDSTPSKDRISALTPKGEKASAKAAKAEAPAPAAAEPTQPTPEARQAVRRKQGATPTRRAAEAARMERLHPTLTPKQQRKADSAAKSRARAEAWDRVEKSPERQLLRDYVDTRWTAAEFMMPAMILVMAAVMVTMNNVVLSSWISMSLWVMLAITIINVAIMWRGFKKLLAERHPGASTRGLLVYMFNRSLMIRRFRQPAPRIKRGDPI